MADPQKHSDNLDGTIGGKEVRLSEVFDRQHLHVLRRFNALLRQYPLDVTIIDGKSFIRPTAKNLQIANRIWRELVKSSWPKYVTEEWAGLGVTLEALERLNATYWRGIEPRFKNRPTYQDLTKEAQAITRGMLTREEQLRVLDAPINNMLRTYVRDGGDVDRMIETLRRSLKGEQQRQTGPDQAIGQSFFEYRNLNRRALDTMYTYSRSYNALVGQSLDSDFWYYSGGTVPDTRAFCMQRHEQYWHTKEIENWGRKMKWKGRRRGTNAGNIFQFLGGYQCRHNLIGATISMVAEKDLKRMRERGLIE